MFRKFTLSFSTIFTGFFDFGASREVFPKEVRSPEIGNVEIGKLRMRYEGMKWMFT